MTGAVPCKAPGLKANDPSGCTPLWGIPGSARASALPQKINLHGTDGYHRLAARRLPACTRKTRA